MTLSMYQASVPFFVRILGNLSTILKTAEEFAEKKKIEPSVLINSRIAPDMFPLARQIQIASDSAKGAVARLAGLEVPSYADTETTFAELQERIAKTIKFAQEIKPEQMEGSEAKKIVVKTAKRELNFEGLNFLFGFSYPNFYFHVTTAYAILRHNGVEIGKMDFIGKPE
jgi:hypothetical protein